MTRRPRPPARSAPRRSRQSALWRDRRFCVFLTSQTLSVAGDSFALIAVPLLILRATGSVAQMGLLTGAAGAAAVVAGIFAGDPGRPARPLDPDGRLRPGPDAPLRPDPAGLVGTPGGLAPVRDPAAVRRPRHGLPGRLRDRGPGPVRPGPDHRSQRAALRSLIDGRDRRSAAGRPGLRRPRPGQRDRGGRGQLRGFGGRRASRSPESFGVQDGSRSSGGVRGPRRGWLLRNAIRDGHPGHALDPTGKRRAPGRRWRTWPGRALAGAAGRGPVPVGSTLCCGR